MKIIYHILIVIIINLGVLFPIDYAYPIENGAREMGVFQPRVYGMKKNLEISTHPFSRIKQKHDNGQQNGE